MKKNKKLLGAFLAASLVFSYFTPNSKIYASTIYENKESEYLKTGILREHYERFTSAGWQNINVIRIDIKNGYNQIKAIFNQSGISNRSTVKNMVNQSGAVVAVNGDYFNYEPLSSPLGIIVDNGKVLSSPQNEKNKLPAFYMDQNNNAYINYLTGNFYVINMTNAQKFHVSAINKAYKDFKPLVMLTSAWGKKSFGSKYGSDMTEVLVINDIVNEVRTGGEAFDIPDNGYVLSQKNDQLKSLIIGTPLQTEINSNIDLNSLKMAAGGGSIILKDGVAMQSNIVNAGRHPRSGIGVTQDYSQIIIVTVDGRSNDSIGLEQKSFGELFKSLGAYNALNLDGGGSTQLVKKTQDMDDAQVINKPYSDSLRPVVEGIGVFSSASEGAVAKLELKFENEKGFKGIEQKYFLKAYDAQNNPLKIDPSALNYSIEGVQAQNNYKSIIPQSEGLLTLNVSYNGISASDSIKILGDPLEIRSSYDSLFLNKGEKVVLTDLTGYDKDGNSAPIPISKVTLGVYGDVGTINGSTFTAGSNEGRGYITMVYKSAIKNIPLTIGFKKVGLFDPEAINTAVFKGYPDKVSGSLKAVDTAHSGQKSIQLSYDFTKTSDTRAAYYYLNNPIILPGSPKKLGIWVNGDNSKGWLRASLTDKNNDNILIDFTKSVDFSGWKYLEADIPDNDSFPYKLNSIYIAQLEDRQIKSKILIDDMYLLYEHDYLDVADNSSYLEDKMKGFTEKKGDGSYVFVGNYLKSTDTNTKTQTNLKIANKINSVDQSILLSSVDSTFKNLIKTPLMINNNKFSMSDMTNYSIVNLNTKNRDLRTSDLSQWTYIINSLKNIQNNNVLVTMSVPLFDKGGFKDKKEAELLHKNLKELSDMGKNVFVVYKGSVNKSYILDKIRYISIYGGEIKSKGDLKKMAYVQFTFNNDSTSFNIYPLN